MFKAGAQRLVEIHIQEARKDALQLMAFSGAVFPEEWSNSWNEIVTSSLLNFAYHARKVNEMCGFNGDDFSNISNMLMVKISENDPGNWQKDYQYALNAFIHIKSFVIGNTHADHRKIFTSSSANLMATYVKIETDRFVEQTISICGLAFCFLTEVIPMIKKRFPELQF